MVVNNLNSIIVIYIVHRIMSVCIVYCQYILYNYICSAITFVTTLSCRVRGSVTVSVMYRVI